MKLYDLIRTIVFDNFYVLLEQDERLNDFKICIYDFEKDERECLKPYLDYVVKCVEMLNYTSDKRVDFVITIKGQKIV